MPVGQQVLARGVLISLRGVHLLVAGGEVSRPIALGSLAPVQGGADVDAEERGQDGGR